MPKTDRPWWADNLPDVRACATVAMFVMVFYILHLLATHVELQKNELFKTVATLLIGSGSFGLACSFIWGGSKTSAAASETVNKMALAPSTATASAGGSTATATTTPDPAVPPVIT